MSKHRGDMERLVKQLQRAGLEVTRSKSGHWKVRDPSGRVVYCFSGTPGDRRTLANTLSGMRRAGIDIR